MTTGVTKMAQPRPPIALTLLLACMTMLGAFAIDTFVPSFQAIAQEFTLSLAASQQTLTVYLCTMSLMTLFYGVLSDAMGRKTTIVVALSVFTVASFSATIATSFEGVLLCRALQGLAGGAGRVVSQAIIRDLYSGPVAHRMLAQVMMLFGIAPAVAPILGGYLQVMWGWRSIFACVGGLSMLLLAAVFWSLKETLPVAGRRPLKVSDMASQYRAALTRPGFVMRAVATGLCFTGFALYISCASDLVLNILKLSETQFAWLFVPLIGGQILGAAFAGALSFRLSLNRHIMLGYALMLCSALLLAANLIFSVATIGPVSLAILVYSVGSAFSMPALAMRALDLIPEMRGMASSLITFSQTVIFAVVSGLIAPLLFGNIMLLQMVLCGALGLSMLLAVASGACRVPTHHSSAE